MQELDQRDRDILHILQTELPIASTPFAIVGQMIDMSEKEVIKRVARLKSRGVIRSIAGFFDSRSLGFETCLVAATVDEDDLEHAATSINQHPGVSQNYQRNHEFNLWFTIAVPPDSRLGLERTIDILGEEAGCSTIRMLPTLRQFRSSVSDEDVIAGDSDQAEFAPGALTAEDRQFIRLLQEDLPLQPRPFDALARITNLGADELLEAAQKFHQAHQLRRIAATVVASKPSFSATAMGVWIVPEERSDEVGRQMAAFRGVSQCYLRPTYQNWPYNLFTIVHGRTVDECESVLEQLAAETGLSERQALFPVREFKREHVTLFSPGFEEWEAERAPRISSTAAS